MKIKEIRKNLNLSQIELAKKLNTSQNTISNYEAGNTQPSIEMLVNIANVLDVSLDYLCGRVWHNQIGYIPDDKKDLVNLALKLNEANTIKAFGFISGLLANQN